MGGLLCVLPVLMLLKLSVLIDSGWMSKPSTPVLGLCTSLKDSSSKAFCVNACGVTMANINRSQYSPFCFTNGLLTRLETEDYLKESNKS